MLDMTWATQLSTFLLPMPLAFELMTVPAPVMMKLALTVPEMPFCTSSSRS